jgi:hypothetical protein
MKKQRAFDLSVKWLKEKWEEQEGRCFLTGVKLLTTPAVGRKAGPRSPSLHRLDCKLGYTRDNVVLTSWWANVALNEWGRTELIELVDGLSIWLHSKAP